MCQAFAKRATGNYLWQVDSDEFYREEDMPAILDLLAKGAGQIVFPQHSFWGGLDCTTNGFRLAEFDLKGAEPDCLRGETGFRYAEHRPPTVVDDRGDNVRGRGDWTSRRMAARRIYRYHYCLVFPSQVFSKVTYYSVASQHKVAQHGGFVPTILSWHEMNFKQITRPLRMDNMPNLGWIRPFKGQHPQQALRMMADIGAGRLAHELRHVDDIEHLMRSRAYRLITRVLDAMVCSASALWATRCAGSDVLSCFEAIGPSLSSSGEGLIDKRQWTDTDNILHVQAFLSLG